jgi:phosphoribosylformylglycinamidine synthase
LQAIVSDAIRAGLIKSAHDISDGGLAIALAECCDSTIRRPAIGAVVRIPSHLEVVKDLFGEYCSRIILTTTQAAEIMQRAEHAGLRCSEIGKVGGSRFILEYEGERAVDVVVDELEAVWRRTLPKLIS